MRGAQQGFDSRASRLITPPKGAEAGGNCFSDLSDSVAAGEQGSGVDCCANAALAPKVASNKPRRPIRSSRALYIPAVSLLLNDSLRFFILVSPFTHEMLPVRYRIQSIHAKLALPAAFFLSDADDLEDSRS